MATNVDKDVARIFSVGFRDLSDAFSHVVPTAELDPSELQRLARAAFDIGYLPSVEISGMVFTP